VHTDVHQHVWPGPLVEELRRRTRPPRLDGWTLITAGEPPFAVDPADHDVRRRAALAARDGVGLAVVGLSSPLGIEYLDPADAGPLLRAYHDGVAGLGDAFAGWAAACLTEIDAPGLARLLDQGFVGLQLPATALADEAGYRRCGPLLDVLAGRDRPLFIHPGPAGPAAPAAGLPGWWAAVVPYVQQMHAAWFAFRAWGRPAYPRLRVCFTALAGLAPLHGERLAARGGSDPLTRGIIDPGMFVETSSYGHRAVDAVLRVLGVDALVLGSDRPYAEPLPADVCGTAVQHAIRVANPARLLHGDPLPPRDPLSRGRRLPQDAGV
jgi:6-methylsalicylate decarboxylase